MSLQISEHSRAVLQALFVTFLWSTSWVLIKVGLEDIPPLTFAGLRYFLAFLILLPIAVRRRRRHVAQPLHARDWRRLVVLGFLYYTVTQGTQFVALSLLPAVTISLLLNFTTVVVAFLGIFYLGERLGWLQWAGTAIFIVGALIFFYEDLLQSSIGLSNRELVGFAVAIAGVLANALSAIIGRGVNRDQRISALSVTVISMGAGSAALLISGITLQGLPALKLSSWLIIAWLAVVNTAFAFSLWNHTLRTLPAVESSIINNTMLIQIAVLAWLFLDEKLTALQVGGILLAALGVLAVQLRRGPTRERASVETAELP